MFSSGGFVKGMVAGLIVGAGVAMAVDPVSDRQRRRLKRKTEGFFKNVGSIIDGAVSIMR